MSRKGRKYIELLADSLDDIAFQKGMEKHGAKCFEFNVNGEKRRNHFYEICPKCNYKVEPTPTDPIKSPIGYNVNQCAICNVPYYYKYNITFDN
jgi:uncharacterized protein with PIN domain